MQLFVDWCMIRAKRFLSSDHYQRQNSRKPFLQFLLIYCTAHCQLIAWKWNGNALSYNWSIHQVRRSPIISKDYFLLAFVMTSVRSALFAVSLSDIIHILFPSFFCPVLIITVISRPEDLQPYLLKILHFKAVLWIKTNIVYIHSLEYYAVHPDTISYYTRKYTAHIFWLVFRPVTEQEYTRSIWVTRCVIS